MKPILQISRYRVLVAAAGILVTTLAPAEPPDKQTNPPPADITLTGIFSLGTNKQVLLDMQEPAEPWQNACSRQSCRLREGQKSGPVEILEIDGEAGKVKIRNSGTLIVLSLAGITPPASAPAAIGS